MTNSHSTSASRRGRTFALVAASAWLLASLVGWAASQGKPDAATAASAGSKATAADAAAKPDTVRILIQTVPPRRAQVRWGRRLLGTIPASHVLVLVRPRDSGPLDLVIRAAGFLPVHTRAYTFTDSRVVVKLTAPSEENTLFGYREQPPPVIDGGVPEMSSPSPPPSP
jgi:hypothetical protein